MENDVEDDCVMLQVLLTEHCRVNKQHRVPLLEVCMELTILFHVKPILLFLEHRYVTGIDETVNTIVTRSYPACKPAWHKPPLLGLRPHK